MKFDIQAVLDTLPIMGWGMLGIFIVIGVIMLVVVLLEKIFPASKEKKSDK
ncbi:MAG: OadG-related small transporter subunit [Oscillospiraceae bacterium]